MGNVTPSDEVTTENEQNFVRLSELKAFDETKAGVKGLVDAGITKVPRIFFENFVNDPGSKVDFTVQVIDIDAIGNDPMLRQSIVERVRGESIKWGCFQVVNHGIPVSTLDEMLEGIRRFHEQVTEVKKRWYTRDGSKAVVYNCNYDLYVAASANWRDTAYISIYPKSPNPEEWPEGWRDTIIEYSNHVTKLVRYLFELLSEALNLKPNHLNNMGYSEGLGMACHYYPPCPEPHLTLGASCHTDPDFLTVLLQDHIGGLQFLCDDHWVNIPPVPGALVVNIGDLFQLITNDKFKSGQHRVLSSDAGPRLSVACVITTGWTPSSKIIGPITELLSDDNPPKYRETTVREYTLAFNTKKEHATSALLDFKI